jgi:hypothetical protein
MLKALILVAAVLACSPRPGREAPVSASPRLLSIGEVKDTAGVFSVQDSSYFLMPAHLLLATLADSEVEAELRRKRVDRQVLTAAIEQQRHSKGIPSPSDSEAVTLSFEFAAVLQTAAALKPPNEPVRAIHIFWALLQEPRPYAEPELSPEQRERLSGEYDRADALYRCLARQEQASCASLAEGPDIHLLEEADSSSSPPLILRRGTGWAETRAILRRLGAE